jgi:hypothetical protein
MQVISSDTEIFGLLEKSGQAGFDPGKIFVRDFIFEDDWYLLLFNPFGKEKGCLLFVISPEQIFHEAEKALIPALLRLENFDQLINPALEIVERLLRDKKNERLYFDGH